MKKIKLNQKGVTLVELLAVLVLASLVAGIIWTTISISFKHTEIETTKLQLQQEANLVITTLQSEHRKLDCYQLSIAANEITMKSCEGNAIYLRHSSNHFNYGPIYNEKVNPKEENLELLNFYVENIVDRKKLEVPTVISRYKIEN